MDEKIYIITDDNGRYLDILIGDSGMRQVAESTKEFIEKKNDNDFIKYRIVELPLEGKIHKGHTNIITTIRLNNIPFRAICNNLYNLVEIIDNYMNSNNDYRKYTYHCEFIKIN